MLALKLLMSNVCFVIVFLEMQHHTQRSGKRKQTNTFAHIQIIGVDGGW